MSKKILVVDDEQDIVDLISYNLEREGFAVAKAHDGKQALDMIEREKPALMILDLMLPGIPGMEVCRSLRARYGRDTVPVIMLTAKNGDIDKILGLETGADDYVTKPFNIRELIARVRAVMRRSETSDSGDVYEVFTWKGLYINYQSYEVTVDGVSVMLGPMESKLLHFLSRHPGRVYSRNQLLDHVWGKEAFVEPRTVDAHISRLRAAIERDTENPRYIITVRSIGYKFADIR